MTKEEYVKTLNNVKLIIGNGFDLHCGLHTKYSDFYCKNYKKLLFIQKKYSDFVETDNYSLGLYYNKINLLNVWDVFFALNSEKNPKQCKENWCDIESLILSSLIDADKVEYGDANLYTLLFSSINWPRIERIIVKKGQPTNHLDSFVVRFLNEKMDIVGAQPWSFYSFLLDELKEFEKDFGQFVFKQIRNTYLENLNYGQIFLNLPYIEKAYDTINCLCDINKLVEIDSFNFSYIHKDIFTNILQHINGYWERPIFGIDTIFSPQEKQYIFTKTSRRIESDLIDDWVENKVPFDNVVVFGHSLNKSDYSYFFPVFDHLKLTDSLSTNKIVFAYSVFDKNCEDKILVDLRQSISNILLEYAISKDLPEPKRFLDSLSTEKRIITYRIKDLNQKKYLASYDDIEWKRIYKEIELLQSDK